MIKVNVLTILFLIEILQVKEAAALGEFSLILYKNNLWLMNLKRDSHRGNLMSNLKIDHNSSSMEGEAFR